MKKSIYFLLTLIIFCVWPAAACSPEMKMVSRGINGSATLTPFLPKATFTSFITPMNETDQDQLRTQIVIKTEILEVGDPTQELSETTGEAAVSETPEESQTLPPKSTSAPSTELPTSTVVSGQQFTNTVQPSTSTNPPPAASPTGKSSDPTGALETPAPTETQPPPSPTPVPPATNTQAPPPTETPVPAGCTYSGNSGYESQVVDLINQERSNRGLSPLTQNNQLRQAARGHSQDMACNNFFSHTGSDGSSMGNRILAAGYSYSWAAENIAASSSGGYSPQSVVMGWMNSAGHRKNILNENAKHIGIGFRYVSDGNQGDLDAYYTANFGRP